jgi:hypothetical protein
MVISYAHMVFTEMPARLSDFSANDYLSMSIAISFHVPVDEGWLHMCNFTFFLGHMMNLTYSCPFLSRRRMHYVIFQVSWVGKINERKWRSRNNRGVGFCQMVVSLQCVHVSCSRILYVDIGPLINGLCGYLIYLLI